MKARFLLLVVIIELVCIRGNADGADGWKMQPARLQSRWASAVGPANALPEYPRPQMIRSQWLNLNGLWQYRITDTEAAMPSIYDGNILVPFPLESALSGVEKQLRPTQALWYRRTFDALAKRPEDRVLLHFGAVDYRATVFVNGREAGRHDGGYESFTLDVTDLLKGGKNEIVIRVFDPTDEGPNPHGKQRLKAGGIFYSSASGIWQTVWMEVVPKVYIDRLSMTPDVDRSELRLHVSLTGNAYGCTIEAIATRGARVVAKGVTTGETTLHIQRARLWSPDDPFLYDLRVRLIESRKVVDEVRSYFGMRKIELKTDATGKARIFLNGRYTYNLGVLDQGFWPDGIYTAPTDDALKFDIEAVKAMGFNTIRKHLKIEPDRWYYYCDKLGVIVWQDMVPPSNGSSEGRVEFEKEVKESIHQLYNHPSITTWVIFNETFGDPYDHARLSRWVRELDPSRLLDGQSGAFVDLQIAEWLRHLDPPSLFKLLNGDCQDTFADKVLSMAMAEPAAWAGDMVDLHHYPDPKAPAERAGVSRVLGEYGGVGLRVDGHTWSEFGGWGYIQAMPNQMASTYSDMSEKLKAFADDGLTGSIYTQLTDVEGELDGLVTYDRAIAKIDLNVIRGINAKLVPSTSPNDAVSEGFSLAFEDENPEPVRYKKLVEDYRRGERDLPFLRHLAIMALSEKDQTTATEAGNAYIHGSPTPWSKDMWEFLYQTTNSSRDAGFEILLHRTAAANEILGTDAAEIKLREIINREEIAPYLRDAARTPAWAEIQSRVASKYGAIGEEEVNGRAMIYALKAEDWEEFGKYFCLYFKTASSRSEYEIDYISYVLFEHVPDSRALNAGITAMKLNIIDSSTRDPTAERAVELDTYANLLYKTSKTAEAVAWEEKAMELSDGRDDVIAAHLNSMKASNPTWRPIGFDQTK